MIPAACRSYENPPGFGAHGASGPDACVTVCSADVTLKLIAPPTAVRVRVSVRRARSGGRTGHGEGIGAERERAARADLDVGALRAGAEDEEEDRQEHLGSIIASSCPL